jgi:mannose-6-phosphate isomerase-like protein (cupin superfamily)
MPNMKLKKSRWSKVYESSEEELAAFLQAKGVTSRIQEVPSFEITEEASFSQDTTLYCAEGSLTFQTSDTSISLQPGDSLHVPAGLAYTTVAGIAGYTLYVTDPS